VTILLTRWREDCIDKCRLCWIDTIGGALASAAAGDQDEWGAAVQGMGNGFGGGISHGVGEAMHGFRITVGAMLPPRGGDKWAT
jgi:hypothetical protein